TPESLCIRVKPSGTLSVSGAGPTLGTALSVDAFSLAAPPTSDIALTRSDIEKKLFLQGPRLDLPANPLRGPAIANADPADLDKLFDQATAGDPVAVSSLVGAGRRALDHAVRERLTNADGLERQLIAYLAVRLGDSAAAAFAPVAVSADDKAVASALIIGSQVKVADLTGLIPRFVREKPTLIPLAVGMAAQLHSNTAVKALLPLLADKDPRIVRVTLVALTSIGDEAAAGSAQALLTNSDPVVREEAAQLLALFPKQAQVAADSLISSGDEFNARMGVHLLGLVGTPDALTTVAGLMRDTHVGIRYSALQELAGRMPPSAKRDLPMLLNDPDPRVRALA
ncbi:MAG: HEAT repeat domain-containing protein, partial [Armatimonadota bacterium]